MTDLFPQSGQNIGFQKTPHLIGIVGLLYFMRSFIEIKVPENCLLVSFFIHQQKPRSFSVRYVEEVIFSSLLPWRKWPWRGEGLDLDSPDL